MPPVASFQTPPPGKIKRSFIFARKFLRHGWRIASIVPSSPMMSKRLAKEVSRDTPQMILELGTGTGCVTAAAIKRMHPDSRIVSVEQDAQLAEIAQARCPEAEVICGDATQLGDLLERVGVEKVDVLINCLPTPLLAGTINLGIFDAVTRLMPVVRMTQLTEVPYWYGRAYRRIFDKVKFAHVPLNIPPAGVYELEGLKPDYARYLSERRGFKLSD